MSESCRKTPFFFVFLHGKFSLKHGQNIHAKAESCIIETDLNRKRNIAECKDHLEINKNLKLGGKLFNFVFKYTKKIHFV